jgi:transcription elongation factor GreA
MGRLRRISFATTGFPDMATIPLTRRGAEKLKEELHRLKTVERHAVIQAIAEARAQGDLSENAEYEAAKDKQGFIEGRILELEGKLAAAQVIDPATLDAGGRVVFGATVDLEDEDPAARGDLPDRRRRRGRPEARADLHQQPDRAGLIGKEAGDVAEVQAPGGLKSYEVIDVRYV